MPREHTHSTEEGEGSCHNSPGQLPRAQELHQLHQAALCLQPALLPARHAACGTAPHAQVCLGAAIARFYVQILECVRAQCCLAAEKLRRRHKHGPTPHPKHKRGPTPHPKHASGPECQSLC